VSASTIQFGQLPALLLRAGRRRSHHHPVRRPPGVVEAVASRRPPQERLFMSRLSALDGSRAIRGGVPVIFPQFAERGPGMRHGFARVSTWRVLDSGEQDGAAFAVLGLNHPTWRRRHRAPGRTPSNWRCAWRARRRAGHDARGAQHRHPSLPVRGGAAHLPPGRRRRSRAHRRRAGRDPGDHRQARPGVRTRSPGPSASTTAPTCWRCSRAALRMRWCGIRARPMRRRWPTWRTRSTGASCASSRRCWGRCWSRVSTGLARRYDGSAGKRYSPEAGQCRQHYSPSRFDGLNSDSGLRGGVDAFNSIP
jgi:hypothetical protein